MDVCGIPGCVHVQSWKVFIEQPGAKMITENVGPPVHSIFESVNLKAWLAAD